MVIRFASRIRSGRRMDCRCGSGTQSLTTYRCPICLSRVNPMRNLAAIICVVGLLAAAAGANKESVCLTVKASADPTHAFPSSKLYVASISNGSKAPLIIQAVRMPGGYVGSGVFFPCVIEQWNTESKSWLSIRRTELKQFGSPTVTEQELGPGSEREVCRGLLPKEGARSGACVRFRVSSKFGDQGLPLVSHPFVVGGESEALVPCTAH
jgi:hypothetical protein